ncbi:MAG: class I SAM-dependent methyltransferase [Sedimentisphaerales bacterium]|jgi:SAM-dependent methyltransferase
MGSYLETIYFTDEYSENSYPHKLCKYVGENYFYKIENGRKIYSGRLLDVGSGKGNHLVAFKRCNYQVAGLDKRRECIEALRDFTIKECDIEKEEFPYDDNSFDWVFSKSVLEHVSNTDNMISEILRVLKPGGRAVLMTPAWESQYKFFWDDYTHVKAFTKKSLQNALKINGYVNVNVSLFMQLPFIWRYPSLVFIPKIISLLPDALKWKDYEQSKVNKLIRFSKEMMLLAAAEKPKRS